MNPRSLPDPGVARLDPVGYRAGIPMDWTGKRVLVTGGLGFIGSNLAIRLLREGAAVTICDALIEGYGGTSANIREIASEVEVHIADVRDEPALRR